MRDPAIGSQPGSLLNLSRHGYAATVSGTRRGKTIGIRHQVANHQNTRIALANDAFCRDTEEP